MLCPWYHLGSYLYSSFCSSHLESKHAHHLNRSSRATVWQKTHSTSLKKILTDMSYKIGRYDDDLIRKHNFPAVACEKSLNTFVRSRDIVSSRPPPLLLPHEQNLGGQRPGAAKFHLYQFWFLSSQAEKYLNSETTHNNRSYAEMNLWIVTLYNGLHYFVLSCRSWLGI